MGHGAEVVVVAALVVRTFSVASGRPPRVRVLVLVLLLLLLLMLLLLLLVLLAMLLVLLLVMVVGWRSSVVG
jgi:hypothetical protein